MRLHVHAPTAFTPSAILGDTKLTARSRGNGDVFIGIAPTAAVSSYLSGVRRATVTGIDGGTATLRLHPGTAPPTAPTRTGIWSASSSGSGTQSITWTPENGDWTVVVMNADGSSRVSVDATAGAEVPALNWVIGILLVLAAVALALGIVFIVVPLRLVSRQQSQVR